MAPSYAKQHFVGDAGKGYLPPVARLAPQKQYCAWQRESISFSYGLFLGKLSDIVLCRAADYLILLVDVGDQRSLCVVNDQPVGNPKRKV
jgi:hypothetical protein